MPRPVSKPVERLSIAAILLPLWGCAAVVLFYGVKLLLHMVGVFF